MKMNWFFQTGVAAVSLIGLVACSSTTSTGTGGTGGGAGGSTEATGGTGGTGGTSPYTGTNTCADYITGANWSLTLTMADFKDEAGYNAWDALNTCGCVNTTGSTPAGCLNVCSQPQNTTTTNNFCNGVAALPSCTTCLTTTSCSAEYTACQAN